MYKYLAPLLLLISTSVFSQQLINGNLIKPGTLPTSAAVTPWAPAASPTFTGSVTLPITGLIQCLHVDTSGHLTGTGSDCGSGGGGGGPFLPLAGGTMSGVLNANGGLQATGLPFSGIVLVGNGATSQLQENLTATSTSTTAFAATAQIAMTAQTSGGSLGNAALYTGLEAKSGTGNAWSMNNLLTVDSGAGANTHNFQGIELDVNNNDADSNQSTAINGLDISGAGTKINNTALDVAGNKVGGGPVWLYGIRSGSNSSVQGGDFEAEGAAAWGFDTINYTGNADIRLRNGGVIDWRNGSNSADITGIYINGANQLQLGLGATNVTAIPRLIGLGGFSSNWNVNYAGNTSAEAFMPFQSSQNPTGACLPDGAGNCVYNRIIIGSDNVDASATPNGTIAFQVNENCCSSSAKGTRNVGQFIMNVIGTPADATGNHSYVALETTARVAANLGGTSTSAIATTSGSVFGFNPYVSLASGATNLRGVVGDETDIELATGSSAWAAVGHSVIATINYAVKAHQENVAFEVASQGLTVHPFDVAYQIGGYEGWPGIDTTGGIMKCENNQASGQCPGIGFGIDFSNIASMGGYAFAGPNAVFNVTGPGALTALSINGMTVNSTSGTSGGARTVIGNAAGVGMTTGATGATFIGNGAGGSGLNGGTGGTGISGPEDTCIGWHCFSQMTTGQFNTGIGLNVMGFETTGNNNVAVGTDAMRNTIGVSNGVAIGVNSQQNGVASGNVAIGTNTLVGQTGSSGTNNTAVGTSAMSSSSWSTGGNNSAFGSGALASITTGSSNIGIGLNAGGALTTMFDDDFIGVNTGIHNTGSNNTSLGSQSFGGTGNGSLNVILGYNTGLHITNGSSNMLLGTAVGGTLTTGNNNVIIGTNSSCDVAAAGTSNTFVLCGDSTSIFTTTGTNTPSTSATTIAGTLKTNGYTVSTLPAGAIGMRSYVTDQTTSCPITGGALTGSGAITCPVFYNGTAWVSD